MNDRLKFRVWNPDMESYDDDPQYNVDIKIDQENGLVLTPFHNNIIEFCTELKDKNGKLIYESDYVKDKDGDIYLVKWDAELVQFNATGKDGCGFETITPFMKGETETLEICGNIHEQAEQKDVK